MHNSIFCKVWMNDMTDMVCWYMLYVAVYHVLGKIALPCSCVLSSTPTSWFFTPYRHCSMLLVYYKMDSCLLGVTLCGKGSDVHQPAPTNPFSTLCFSGHSFCARQSYDLQPGHPPLWWLLYVYTLHRTTAFFFAVRVIWRACESCQGGMQCLPGSGCWVLPCCTGNVPSSAISVCMDLPVSPTPCMLGTPSFGVTSLCHMASHCSGCGGAPVCRLPAPSSLWVRYALPPSPYVWARLPRPVAAELG